ncbi:hypothetical protein OAM21_02715, partial [Verrucomicrobia bacterium]|nr:hypothetical protein [Verrucomicrobiota bacterium]
MKYIYCTLWRELKFYQNNHLPGTDAKLVKIPLTDNTVFVRPSKSDMTRVSEFLLDIYINKNFLNEALLLSEPSHVIDIGANIGLSSLSLLNSFKTVTQIIGIEAEKENYIVLNQNYKLWQKRYKNLHFTAYNKIAASDSKTNFHKGKLSKNAQLSSSGTFTFTPVSHCIEKTDNSICVVNDLINAFKNNNGIICK